MSETPPAVPTAAPEKKPLSPFLRGAIGYVVLILLMVIIAFAGSQRAKVMQAESYRRMGDALAQSLLPHYLNRNWAKTDQDLAKIASAANLQEITLTDTEGRMLASTNRSATGTESLKNAPNEASIRGVSGGYQIERKIFLAEGNPIGAIRVIIPN